MEDLKSDDQAFVPPPAEPAEGATPKPGRWDFVPPPTEPAEGATPKPGRWDFVPPPAEPAEGATPKPGRWDFVPPPAEPAEGATPKPGRWNFVPPPTEPAFDRAQEPQPAVSPPRGGIEDFGFSISELRSLALGFGFLFLSFVGTGLISYLPRPEASVSTIPEKGISPGASTPKNISGPAAKTEERIRQAPGVTALIVLLIWGSIFGLCATVTGWMVWPGMKERLQLERVAQRTLPAVWVIDFLVAMALWLASINLLSYLLIQITPAAWWKYNPAIRWWEAQDNAGHVMIVAAQFAAYGVAIPVLLLLVWVRGGKPGLAGLWPFWRNESCEKKMSILADIRLALLAYLLLLSPLWFSNVLNMQLLKALGCPLDENPLVQVFSQESRSWAVLMIMLLATVGAAIAEEFIFRGVLYALLRRYLNRWPSAIIASLVFSCIHGVSTNVLSLFLLGMLLTWMYERTGRLLTPMVLHAVNNGLTMSIILLSMQGSA